MPDLGTLRLATVDVIARMPRCRDCRFWNGNGQRAAPCFKIKAVGTPLHALPRSAAAIPMIPPVPEVYMVTGPDFGCVLFEAGKPRFWGDDGA